ncbi:hypothetical protein BP6252_10677 [Coleophoma cylindrospora]|uniref:Uncharacterized protein n=1 Tax=Coleophoma cylindrospora TaxID=1849047 RepID=A0A3D8QT59_9HELO|nr:hypothetical protein BP6252_10677 [Coleophoma cylindrospora]
MYGSGANQFGGPLAGSAQRNGYGSGSGGGGMMGTAGRTVLEGYRDDIMNGFEKESPRYNPANVSRPQSSTLVNVNDTIQVHLLVETALGDSKEFEILSQEEVDDLKKQIKALSQRIETTRQNLAIQSKYRDAAISMAKLYSPTDKKRSLDLQGKRRSLLGNRSSSSDQVQEADRERLASERKCEELALELWSLEKRLMEPQSRLLKHTAGILQMTHKGPKKMQKSQGASQQNGMPGSPESIYTYSNARISTGPVSEVDLFDERSLYRTADRLDGLGGSLDRRDSMDPIPAPLKSPSREQLESQLKTISMTEEKLEDLNTRLRAVIVKANPQNESSYGKPPRAQTNAARSPGDAEVRLSSHLEYLERGIKELDQDQRQSRNDGAKDAALEETIERLNNQVRGLLLPHKPNQPMPPRLTGDGHREQLAYFQELVRALEMELSNAVSNASRGVQVQDNQSQMETVLTGLWEVIQNGQAEIKRRKQERREARMAQGFEPDEDDVSDDGDDPNEAFSLPAFSSKVQWLYSQATSLKDQKKVLQRQIKQQRELNSKTDATKDAEITQKTEELERTKALLLRTEADANSVRQQLSDIMEQLDRVKQAENQRQQNLAGGEAAAVRAAQDELTARNEQFAVVQEQLKSRTEKLEALEVQIQSLKAEHEVGGTDIQSRLAESEAKITDLTTQVAAAAAAQTKSEEMVASKEKEISTKESELESMFEKVAELQTEVTIARAELDGAYGSRAQRAAEVAANPAIQKELDVLSKKNASLVVEIADLQAAQSKQGAGGKEAEEREKILKKELAETIEEFEQMTKASIEWEKEREELERSIDKLRDERENLEAQLSDEKVKWLGMKSPGVDGAPSPGSTSTTVLKNEFKKMMRDTRTENVKALRAEQEQRRRAEEELRALKKQLGPGKSGLSQSLVT